MGVYEVNEQFNIELANFDALTELHTFNLGKPSPILQACGFDGAFEIRLTKGKVRQKTNKHCYSEAILRDLPLRLQDPLIVAGYLKTSGTLNVVIETFHFNVKESEWQPLLVGVELKQDIQVRGKEQWHVVRSIFPKNLESLGWWIEASTCADSKRIKAAYQPIIYLNKKEISNLLPSHGTIRHVVEKTRNPTTKVVKDFDNPIGEAEVMEFRASLRNAQAEWLSHGRKIFQEEQQKNGKTMNGMDTAKGQGLNPLNCKYSKFVDSCVCRLNRMLRNGETTKETVNTAKHYLYTLKPIAAANGDRLTMKVVEEEDCADSYNALLKQLAQIGGLSKPSKARTTHRKARASRTAAIKETVSISEWGGDSPKPGAETAPAPAPSAGCTPSIAARLLRRFLAIHGKTINRRKVSTLLCSLQRAIVGKEIRKTDRNAELIEQMQIALVQMLDSAWDSATVEFDAKALAALQKSVNSEKQSQTVTLLRAYVRLNDTDDRAKAERLLRRMRKAAAVDGELSQEISAARQNLERFLSSGAQKRLEINPYELQGLCGLLGVDGGTHLSGVDGTVYSGKDVQRMDFQTIKLESRFAEFIGSPEFPFRMMVHGGPGSGKTTFALQLANSLAAHNGKRVLFVSSEEGIGQKLKSKIDRLGLHAPTLYFASTLPDSFADYDAVFIDSVISMGLTAESLREMYRNAPNTTFVAINQETKDGKARGSLEITHDADIACRCENLPATLEKNRYGDTSKNFAIIA